MYVMTNIISISRASLHDGRGIRTVVYLKGCNLRCQWCHNPESQRLQNEVLINPQRCIGCGRCLSIHADCYRLENGVIVNDRAHCVGCGDCAAHCPSNAIEMAAREMTAEQVFAEICKDIPYFERTGGGVTFSGGECLLFPAFMEDILRRCKEAEIHTCVESALHVPWESIERLAPLVDAFLIDIKSMDPDTHMKYVGCAPELILENIGRLSKIHTDILIRVPLIPGVNTDTENLVQTVRFAHSNRPAVQGVELLRYNNLAGSKYTGLGKEAIVFGDGPQSNEEMQQMAAMLNAEVSEDSWVFYR